MIQLNPSPRSYLHVNALRSASAEEVLLYALNTACKHFTYNVYIFGTVGLAPVEAS